MRHKVGLRKLGKSSSHRRAMLRNMATSVILDERCETTVAKAKEIKRVVEKLITLGKAKDLHSRRQAYSYLVRKDAVYKLFEEIAPRYTERNGGYLRVVRTGVRHGDAADLAVVEFV